MSCRYRASLPGWDGVWRYQAKGLLFHLFLTLVKYIQTSYGGT